MVLKAMKISLKQKNCEKKHFCQKKSMKKTILDKKFFQKFSEVWEIF